MRKYVCKVFVAMFFLIGIFILSSNQTVKAADEGEYVLDVQNQEDISQKLQDAIKEGNKHIVIPSGEYYCSGVNLNGTDGVTIEASGETIIKQSGDNPILCVANSYTASNITIKGGIWDGSNIETPIMRFYGEISGI